jgi:hypothetical protein
LLEVGSGKVSSGLGCGCGLVQAGREERCTRAKAVVELPRSFRGKKQKNICRARSSSANSSVRDKGGEKRKEKKRGGGAVAAV